MTKKETWLIFTLAAIQFTHIVDFMILMPLGPQLMRVFEIGPKEFSFLVSAYAFSAATSGFLGASLADKLDRKVALFGFYSGFLFGTLVCALAPTYTVLFLGRVFAGAFGGLLGAQIFAIVGDAIEPERRGQAMGLLSTSFSLASVVGVPAGLWLATLSSWQSPFLALVALGGLLLIVARPLVPTMRNHIGAQQKDLAATLKEIFSVGAQRWALFFSFLMIVGHFSIIPFLSPALVANMGFKESQLTYVYLTGGLTMVIGSPLIGRLADRIGPFRVFAIAVCLITAPVLFLTTSGPKPIALILMVTAIFFLFTSGRFIAAMTLITGTVPPRIRGGFMSVNSSVQQMGTGTASLMGGLIITKGASGELQHYPTLGYVAIVLNAVAVAVLGFISRKAQLKKSQAD